MNLKKEAHRKMHKGCGPILDTSKFTTLVAIDLDWEIVSFGEQIANHEDYHSRFHNQS